MSRRKGQAIPPKCDTRASPSDSTAFPPAVNVHQSLGAALGGRKWRGPFYSPSTDRNTHER
jgi:hypothetical protein